MSAFIVNKRHLDFILTAGLRHDRYGPLHWMSPDSTPEGVYEKGAPWGPEALKHFDKVRRTLEKGTVDAVGLMLWEQNYRSVNFRYDEEDWKNQVETYTFEHFPGDILPVQVLKALGCYEYQSCEDPGWEESEAFAFCDALRHRMIARLPGYEDAAWEIRAKPEKGARA